MDGKLFAPGFLAFVGGALMLMASFVPIRYTMPIAIIGTIIAVVGLVWLFMESLKKGG